MIPRSVRHRMAPARRPRRHILSRYPYGHLRYYVPPAVPFNRGWHVVQEFNAYGNTCHKPGCRLTEDQHPKARP